MLDIIETQIPEAERLGFLPKHLPNCYLKSEQLLYAIMHKASPLYSGGLWEFVELSNGGFYLYPTARDTWPMSWEENYYQGEMSSKAAGIGVSLILLGNLAYSEPDSACAKKFHLLREFALDHEEAAQIFAFID